MRFCRAMLLAKRFIAGVGGRPPASPPTAARSKGGPSADGPSLSLPIMRWATSHTASIAPTISCLPITTSADRHQSGGAAALRSQGRGFVEIGAMTRWRDLEDSAEIAQMSRLIPPPPDASTGLLDASERRGVRLQS
jgi:hypothetical protein